MIDAIRLAVAVISQKLSKYYTIIILYIWTKILVISQKKDALNL